MYITLTNTAQNHYGNKVAINSDLIATVSSQVVVNEEGITESKTFIFCPPHGTWEVGESLEEVVKLLNAEK